MAFVRAGTGSGASADPAVTLAAAPAQGNVLVAWVASASSSLDTDTPASGWSALTGNENIDTSRLFYKVCGAGESATQQPVVLTTSNRWIMTLVEYSGINTTTPIDVSSIINQTTTSRASTAVNPTDGIAATLIGVTWIDGSTRTFTSPNFTG